jgi:transcriptional regulator with XRE-family HTH domain
LINDRLRDALLAARLTPEDLAADLDVNPKTVERWITQSRVPYPQFRHRISVLAQKSESYLWPNSLSPRRRAEVSESEIVQVYPYRADVPDELWARLFENAVDNISILVYSGFFLPEQHKSQIELLRQKADDGAAVRLLLGDPDSAQVALRGEEEDIGDAIAAKIRNVLLAYYASFASYPGINIKLHSTTLYNSIFWFDDDMLVNTHAYGVPAHFAPTLHLRHLSSGTLFQTYARSFDRVWDQTQKVWTGRKAA